MQGRRGEGEAATVYCSCAVSVVGRPRAEGPITIQFSSVKYPSTPPYGKRRYIIRWSLELYFLYRVTVAIGCPPPCRRKPRRPRLRPRAVVQRFSADGQQGWCYCFVV